jgi:hypothetical protein
MKNKSQIWSLDSIFASVIFVTFIFVFVFILTMNNSKTTHEEIQNENIKINQIVNSPESNFYFLNGPNVDINLLKTLQDQDYKTLKDSFSINSDFCIYFEDMNGSIINISTYTNQNLGLGLGHNQTKLGNNPCSTK